MTTKTIVFDFGGVLFRTSTEEFYRDLFRKQGRSEEELRHFLDNIFINAELSLANSGNARDFIEEKAARHPEWEGEIRAFTAGSENLKWIRNVIPGMKEVLGELTRKGYRVVGLTNWHGDIYDALPEAFPEILGHLSQVVVSGKVGMRKPDPAIFRHAHEAFGSPDASDVYYFDDKPRNTETAQKTVGWNAFVFKNADTVRQALAMTEEAPAPSPSLPALTPKPF